MIHLSSSEALSSTQLNQNYLNLINSGIINCGGDFIQEEIANSQLSNEEEEFSCILCKYIVSSFANFDEAQKKWVCPSCEFKDNKLTPAVKKYLEILKKYQEKQDKGKVVKSDVSVLTSVKQEGRNSSVLFVFLLDFSGSMCTTYEAPQQNNIDQLSLDYILNSLGPDELEKYFADLEKQETYVSRKKMMISHVADCIENLSKDPKNKYFIILFGKQISIMGNDLTEGKFNNIDIRADSKDYYGSPSNPYDEFNYYLEKGKSDVKLDENSKFNKEKFKKKLLDFKENGGTPLGPALAVGLGVAERLKCAYTKIFIFTDGVANVGIGSMINDAGSKNQKEENDKSSKKAKENYKKIFTPKAIEVGAIINFFTFIDEESSLKCVKDLAMETKGEMFQMDFKKRDDITQYLDIVSKVQVTAVEAVLRVYISNDLVITFCKDDAGGKQESSMTKSSVFKRLQNLMENARVGFHYDLSPNSYKPSSEAVVFQSQLDFFDYEKNKFFKYVCNRRIPEIKSPEEFWKLRDKLIDIQTMNMVLIKDNTDPASSEVLKQLSDSKFPYPEQKKKETFNNYNYSGGKGGNVSSSDSEEDDTTTITVIRQKKENNDKYLKPAPKK